jgi:hypothetical protein
MRFLGRRKTEEADSVKTAIGLFSFSLREFIWDKLNDFFGGDERDDGQCLPVQVRPSAPKEYSKRLQKVFGSAKDGGFINENHRPFSIF